ncbi:MAG: aquaporin family protein [Verrucomicrobiota bacterium]|jgi:aquaporin Z|nr:aquaporin family protein [Chthoniobacterales bacterium]MDQ3116806.1 aquaporin family protein [Verrucomicrobiota bacterium]
MNKYICEFIGTFFLVLTVGSTVIDGGAGVIPPLAIGAMLMVMIFATGHISGGHLNPAVTLAVWMRGKLPLADVPGYIIGQVGGGLLAAYLVLYMKGNPTVTPMQFDSPAVPFLAEFLGTFALAFVVLNVATAKANSNNSFYGLAIGFTVVAAAFAFGSYSGGAFNPAVALGITAMGLNAVANVWIHLLADFAGGATAALAFRYLSPERLQQMVVAPQEVKENR